MRLVHVVWDEDEGLVDTDTDKVICYAWGKHYTFNCCDGSIPYVELTDKDFPEPRGPSWDEAPAVVRRKLAEVPSDANSTLH